MGDIRTFQRSTVTPQASFVENRSALSGVVGADTLRQAGTQIGQTLSLMQKERESAEQSDVFASLAEFKARKTIEWNEALRTADPNDRELPTRFIEQMNSELHDLGDKVKHDVNKRFFKENEASIQSTFLATAYVDTQDMLNTAQEANQQRQEDAFSNLLVIDPTQLNDVTEQYRRNVESNNVFSTATKEKRIRSAEQRFANASLDGWITPAENNPDITVEQIDMLKDRLLDPELGYSSKADPGTYQEAFKRLERLKVTASNVHKAETISEIGDIIKSYATFGGDFLQEAYDARIAELDPEADASTINNFNRAVEEARVSVNIDEGIVNQPYSETATELSNEVVEFQAGTIPVEALNERMAGHDARGSRLQDHIEKFNEDPSGWAVTYDSSVQARALEFFKNPSPVTFGAFADATTARQKMFSPYTDTKILTGVMADMIGQMIKQAEKGTPGAITVAREGLQAQRELAGDYWPQVSSELLEEGTITPIHYVVANLPPRAEQLSDTLLQLSGFSETELSNMIKDDPSALSDARDQAIGALSPFQDTLVNTPGGLKIAAAWQEALTKLILSKDVTGIDIVKNTFWDGSDAKSLAERMVLGDYNFVGGMRVPKAQNVANVKAATAVAQRNLSADMIAIPGRITTEEASTEMNWLPPGLSAPYTVSPFDTNKFPPIINEDGSVSHIIIKSFGFDGQEVLIPTMADGKKLTDDEAKQRFLETGEHFGKFDSVEAANAFAKILEDALQTTDLDGNNIAHEQDLRSSSARAFGTWVTNFNETGVLLLDEVGHPVQVKDARGVSRPYEFTWEELEQLQVSDRDRELEELRERRRNRLGIGPRGQ